MKVYNDLALVEAYLKCERCRIVAEEFGCSDETVRRALIKYDVKRTKRHPRPKTKAKITKDELLMIIDEYYNSDATINKLAKKYRRSQKTISDGLKELGHGFKYCEANSKKVSDETLIEESKIYTRNEIAERHHMNLCNVDRQLKRLNIKCRSGLGKGSGHSHYLERCKSFNVEYDESITLKALYTKANGICAICGKPTICEDRIKSRIGKMYPTIDHIIPLSKGGSHTWNNVQLAHMRCNSKKGDKYVVNG